MKYAISILSLIISVIALAVAIPRQDIGFDYLGVIVAIISLAATAAIGFQIWNTMSFEKRLNELRTQIESENESRIKAIKEELKEDYDNKIQDLISMKEELKKDYDNKIQDLYYAKEYMSYITSSYISYNSGSYSRSFLFCIKALEFNTKLQRVDTPFDECFVELMNSYLKSLPVQITDPKEQDYIINTIIESKNENLIEKIGVIKSKIFSSES